MSRAASRAASPTAPAPNTTRVEPGSGRSTLSTAPAPVCTPQPNGASSSGGRPPGTGIAFRSVTSEWVAKEDWPKKCPCSGEPSAARRVGLPSARAPPNRLSRGQCSQRTGRPVRQSGHRPQEVKVSTTGWPGRRPVTALPTRRTVPAPSWPSTAGSGPGVCPARTLRSVWQIPAAATSTSTSSGRGSSSRTGSSRKGSPGPRTTAAVALIIGQLQSVSGW
ncbi:hypothetical protein GCM10020229_03120 [Kitasatospora albolonga]